MRYDGWKITGEEIEAAAGKNRYKQIGGLTGDAAGEVGVSMCENQIDGLSLFLVCKITKETDPAHEVPERSAGYDSVIMQIRS